MVVGSPAYAARNPTPATPQDPTRLSRVSIWQRRCGFIHARKFEKNGPAPRGFHLHNPDSPAFSAFVDALKYR